MRLHPITACVALVVASLASGCALTSKADPTILKYYSLDAPRHRPHPPGSPAAGSAPLQLRLGRVNAASYIRDRIVYRDSSVEMGYFEDLRWTEKPEAYVRRDLTQALFEDEGVQEVVGGVGPTLEVDLDTFDEVREPQPVARVTMTWVLRDDTVVLMRDTIVLERPLPKDPAKPLPKDLAVAMSAALDDGIDRIVKAVVPKLAATPSAAADVASR